jgi:uncharacterized DUF497 family protein
MGGKRLLVVEDPGHSAGEPPFPALGITIGGGRLQVTFTLRVDGTRIRVIAARDMRRKERQIEYDRIDAQTV